MKRTSRKTSRILSPDKLHQKTLKNLKGEIPVLSGLQSFCYRKKVKLWDELYPNSFLPQKVQMVGILYSVLYSFQNKDFNVLILNPFNSNQQINKFQFSYYSVTERPMIESRTFLLSSGKQSLTTVCNSPQFGQGSQPSNVQFAADSHHESENSSDRKYFTGRGRTCEVRGCTAPCLRAWRSPGRPRWGDLRLSRGRECSRPFSSPL